MSLDVEKIRKDFPILKKNFVYLDSACTTLKPKAVIDAVLKYYKEIAACAGRSVHDLSIESTREFENARKIVAGFINAKPNEIVWTKNTTEAINLVAHSLAFKKGDKIVVTNSEHHSNLLPWQLLMKKGAKLDFVFCDDEGKFNLEDFEKRLKGANLLAVQHVSNVTGVIHPIKDIVKIAHDNDALVVVDGAQSVPHIKTDVKKIGCDFLAFSGHKMLGPSGIGCLYGKYDLLEDLDVFMVGGETVEDVKLREVKFSKPPHKFEAGIQHYAGAIGLGAAVKYLQKIGLDNIHAHERKLIKIMLQLCDEKSISYYGPKSDEKVGVFAFNINGIDFHDAASLYNNKKIYVRSGMHCALPLMNHFGVSGSIRASLYLYNTESEVEKFIAATKDIIKIFGK